MPFWFTLLIFAASTFVGELLKPKADKPKAKGLNEFSFPTASESRPVPVIWGTVLQKAPNVIWFGDYKTTPIKQKGGTWGLFGGKVTVGFRYYIGVAYSICFGEIDAIEEVLLDEKSAWTGSVKDGAISINSPDLFGGDKERGGFIATLDVQSGTRLQRANEYLKSKLGLCTANRDICVVTQRGPSGAASSGYVGTDENMEAIAFRVRRCPKFLPYAPGANYFNIGGDANPSEMIFELLTSDVFGMGVPISQINVSSFVQGAQVLHGEGLGISLIWDAQTSVKAMIEEISRYIDGLVYVDLQTGLYNLKLARKDYDEATLIHFDEDTIDELVSYTRGDLSETTNEVRATYTDRAAGFSERVAYAHDPANFYMQNEPVASEVDYKGISSATMAAKLAQRDCDTLSYPLAKHTIRVNRRGHRLHEGAVYKWSWAEDGIVNQVMRVLSINYGRLSQGVIEIQGVQDVFALGSNLYAAPQASEWVDPISGPAQVVEADVEESPYFFARDEEARLIVAAAQANDGQRAFDLLVSENGGSEFTTREEGIAYAPTGVLQSAYGAGTADVDNVGFVLTGGSLDQLEDASATEIETTGKNIFRINDEYMAFETVVHGTGQATITKVWRGLLDTIPQAHAAGSRAWFVSYGGRVTEDVFANGTKHVKAISTTSRGRADEGAAAVFAVAVAGRAVKPYPVGNLRTNDTSAIVAGVPGAPYLTDDFNDNSVDASKWTAVTASGNSVTEINQRIEMSPVTGASNIAALRTQTYHDIRGREIVVEVPQADRDGTLNGNGDAAQLVFAGSTNFANQNGFVINRAATSQLVLYAYGVAVQTLNYDPVVHRWLRLQVGTTATPSSRVLAYAVSADGSNWTTLRSDEPISSVDTQYQYVGMRCNVSSGGTVRPVTHFDNFAIRSASTGSGGTGRARVEWSQRNRKYPNVVKQSAGDIAPEAGTSHTVKIYGETGQLIKTVTNATSPVDYTATQELADTGLSRLQTNLRFDVTAIRDGHVSTVNSKMIMR